MTSIRPYPLGRLVVATALLIVFLVGATSWMLFVSYEDTLRQAKTNLRNLSIAFSAQTFSVAQAVENVMLQAERGHAANGADAPPANSLANFGENSLAREYLLGVHLYDNAGRLIASGVPAKPHSPTRPSPGEIRSAIDAKVDALRITITDVNPMTGRGVINFTRPTVDANGTRTGTILAQADSERFERIYSLVELGKGGSVTLF
ncbi:MAG: cache domain-containing protein, partial [Pseudomonadota bacterium]|nr:cache domain-containing protein [Pseudomonadota bacterium]